MTLPPPAPTPSGGTWPKIPCKLSGFMSDVWWKFGAYRNKNSVIIKRIVPVAAVAATHMKYMGNPCVFSQRLVKQGVSDASEINSTAVSRVKIGNVTKKTRVSLHPPPYIVLSSVWWNFFTFQGCLNFSHFYLYLCTLFAGHFGHVEGPNPFKYLFFMSRLHVWCLVKD